MRTDNNNRRDDEIRVPEYDPDLIKGKKSRPADAGRQNNAGNLNYYQRLQEARRAEEGRQYSGGNSHDDTYYEDAYNSEAGSGRTDNRRYASDRDYDGYPDDDFQDEDEDDYDPGDDYDFGHTPKRKKKKYSAHRDDRDRRGYGDRRSRDYDDRYRREYDEDRRRRRHRKKKRHPVRRFFLTILILLLILLAAFLILLHVAFSRLNRVDPVADTSADEATSATGVEPYSEKGVMNVLLIGTDAREGEGQTRSDTMIVCSLNTKTHQIALTSLMRDMYVPIAGTDYSSKLNAAYAVGGMETLDETVQENFQIDINGNAEVNLESFLTALTSVGDLDIELTQEEADYMNQHPEMGSDKDQVEETWNLQAGVNRLTPSQVLGYSRMRYVGNSDWDRTRRQRIVIQTAFAKIRHNPVKLLQVANEAAPSITTDMTDGYLTRAVFYALLCGSDMTTNQIPGEGEYYADTVDGAAVLIPDLDACVRSLRDFIYNGQGTQGSIASGTDTNTDTTRTISNATTQPSGEQELITDSGQSESLIDPTTGQPWTDLDGDGAPDVDEDHDGIPDSWGDTW